MDLSVVICVRNGRSVIGKQLDALAVQKTSIDWEVVVADNGSTDSTREYCEQRSKSFPVPLRVVDAGKQPSIPIARNVGAQHAAGSVIAYCDSDDEVVAGWVQAAWNSINKGFDIVAGQCIERSDSLFAHGKVLNPGCLIGQETGNLAVMAGNFAVKKKIFIEVGGFDEGLPPYGCEEFDFSIRLKNLGAEFGAAPDMVILFQPTHNKKKLIKKIYRSAMAEHVLWHRHPERFSDELRPHYLMKRFIRWPVDSACLVYQKRSRALNPILRSLVNLCGHMDAEVRWVRLGKLKPGKYLQDKRDNVDSLQ
ncbi:glycosyltransferase family 2 protein [Actinomyces vulturis]|uniref:glycosyltransferase family 2 protein n=1 Tax=Actinomyces vulturis TaxID=1857645 RepID=UPI00082989CE|nr:glycosyltransferase [Actinomyces vulturis]